MARVTRANAINQAGAYQALDAAGIESWLHASLREFSRLGRVTAIVPVAHGAAAAVIRGGRLACAPMDYEQALPPDVHAAYLRARDAFEQTGSPSLPNGLNLGAQLFWLESMQPELLTGDSQILLWPQYWAWVLCGIAASEVTSLGCHTDLWQPWEKRPSDLAVRRGWYARLPPMRGAAEALGSLTPEWRRRTGLSTDTQVLCGLHDSNAALLAARGFDAIAERDATVVSTGTWFMSMRCNAPELPRAKVPAHRDCLINVDVRGRAVPTARFMGGREIDVLCGGAHPLDASGAGATMTAALNALLRSGSRVLPTLAPGVGPYPHARHRWDAKPGAAGLRTVIELYAALVTDTCLDLIGARELILIEGRFSACAVFTRALAALRPQDAVLMSEHYDGVAYGGLRLNHPELPPAGALQRVEPLAVDLADYRRSWRAEAQRLNEAA